MRICRLCVGHSPVTDRMCRRNLSETGQDPDRVLPDERRAVRDQVLLSGSAHPLGLSVFGKRINGFDGAGIPLTGPETRTASPVRIDRDDRYLAKNYKSVYPCGEGAGYAGGIVSAAVDGVRVAKEIIERYDPERISEE